MHSEQNAAPSHINRYGSFRIARRSFLGATTGWLVGRTAVLPLIMANAPASTAAADITASIETLRLLQKSVRASGHLRAQTAISNLTRSQQQGFVRSTCRNTDSVVVDEEELYLLLAPGETALLTFTSNVGRVKGPASFMLTTRLSSKIETFEVV
jgi:hypothetical protein